MTETKEEQTPLAVARTALTREFGRAYREGDGSLPEADTDLNAANRRVVEAMQETHGEAWLGCINLYGEDRGNPEKAMWRWDGSIIYTFGSAFVAPNYDEELVRLIMERDNGPYTTTKADAARIESIFKRLDEVGGVHLVWT